MAYAQVLVYGPDSVDTASDVEYQNGRTDALGHFAFVPHKAGNWRVIATETGHRGEVVVQVDDAGIAKAETYSVSGSSNAVSTFLGISIIGNLLAVGLLWRRREKQTSS